MKHLQLWRFDWFMPSLGGSPLPELPPRSRLFILKGLKRMFETIRVLVVLEAGKFFRYLQGTSKM